MTEYLPSLKDSNSLHGKILNAGLTTWRSLQLLVNKNFKVRKLTDKLWEARRGNTIIVLTYEHLMMLLAEWEEWEQYYTHDGLMGKIVLDIGGGVGESAYFFLDHGAYLVKAVEMDLGKYTLMNLNKAQNNWRLIPTNLAFNEKTMDNILATPHNFLKLDVEGAEKCLLEYEGGLGSCVMEVHPSKAGDMRLHQKLMMRFDLQLLGKTGLNTFILGSKKH